MIFDIVTIFPKMVQAPLLEGIVGRAIERGALQVRVHDLRDFTTDRHRVVDDVPFGGGPGMVLKPEPLFRAVAKIREDHGEPGAIVLTSPDGAMLTQRVAERLRGLHRVVVLCDGKILEDGPPESVLEQPKTERMRTFLQRVMG